MPKSRNRKNRKAYIAPQSFNLVGLWADQIQTCNSCTFKRYYFEFDELPDSERQLWKEQEDFELIDFFLYCPDCKEYSAIYK